MWIATVAPSLDDLLYSTMMNNDIGTQGNVGFLSRWSVEFATNKERLLLCTNFGHDASNFEFATYMHI